MTSHFYTPSFGDEEFALDTNLDINSTVNHQQWQANSSTTDTNYIGTDTDMASADETDDRYNLNQSSNKQKPKNKDPNEPSKPVSAYAAFFRDTQIAIKGQNPNAEFTEVSKIVSSMWDALDPEHKNVYKKNAEIAKREYIKSLAEYRANVATIMSSPAQHHQQQQQHQSSTLQQQIIINSTMKQIPIASKPAVFTISRLVSPQDQTANIVTPTNLLTGTNAVAQKPNIMTSPTQNLINASTRDEQEQIDEPNIDSTADSSNGQKCIRDGCENSSMVNLDWEDEYCSNECVIKHCQDVFTKWVQSNQNQQSNDGIVA